jgi:hypothetical protein
MQQVNSYIYDNNIYVQYDIDPEIQQRNRVVYTSPIQVYKGVDNILKVKVQNADQKPVNISGYTLIFNVVDDYVYSNATVVLAANVTVINANIGLGTVTLSKLDLVQLDREQYIYNVKVVNGASNVAAYVDDNYGSAGQLRVSSAAYPVNPVMSLDLGLVGDSVESFIEDFGMI